MRGYLVALCLVLAASQASSAQENEADRERTERVAEILAILGAKDGARIADVGSADGFYTVRMARAVAPTGRAYAVDIDAAMLEKLQQRAIRENISNIEVIRGETNDPKLPAAAIDAVLIRNAYHEMPDYKAVLAGVSRALRPGGILVVIESIRDNSRALSREQQVKEHEIAPELVDAELRDAGFEILERHDPFTEFTRGCFWLIRARRP